MSAQRPPVISLTYDRDRDMLLLSTGLSGRPEHMRRGGRAIFLRFTRNDRLLSIEIRGARRHVPRESLDSLAPLAQYLTLREAAAYAHLSPVTFRVQIRAGVLPATKRGRDWLVGRKDLDEYLAGREARRGVPFDW